MRANHGEFDVLCALAVAGQLRLAEQGELREHAAHCLVCQESLAEFGQIGMQLFLARSLKNPGKRLPKDMQQRFVARATREGLPLHARSHDIGFGALALVSVVLAALLLVASTLERPSLPPSAGMVTVAGAAPLQRFTGVGESDARQVAHHPGRHHTSRKIRSSPLPVPSTGTRAYNFSAAQWALKVTTTEMVARSAPRLVAECEHCAFLIFARPAAQSFHGSFDLDAYRAGLKPDFKANVRHLVWNVVPQ